MKYKVLSPSTTADKVPVDFKLDNCMLRHNENFEVFMTTFTKHLKRLFFISLEKSCAKTIVETSRPDISPALHANLLTYQLAYISIQMLKNAGRMVIFDVKFHD